MDYINRKFLILTSLLIGLYSFNGYAATYERVLDAKGQARTDMVKRVEDGAFIPTDPNNRDYKEYLKKQQNGTLVVKTPTYTPPVPDPIKAQAKKDLNDKTKTSDQRIDALIKLLDLGQ